MYVVGSTAFLATVFITTLCFTGSYGQCASPQYIEIGKKGLIDCAFPSTFTGVVWYDSQDTSNSQIARVERQPDGSLRISPENVETANYTISSNGSLIIRFVTMHHNQNFSVLLFDENNELSFSIVELITVVYTHQKEPSVNSCKEQLICLTLLEENDTLSCTYRHARPPVNLTWYTSNDGKLKRIDATQRSFLDDVSFTSVLDIQPSNITKHVLSVLTCQAVGPALRIQNVTKTVLVLNPRMKHCAECDNTVEKKTVLSDNLFQIPCTDSGMPHAYVWLYEQHGQTEIIAFSINMTLTFVYTLDIPMNVSKKGSLIVSRASLSSGGKYTCFFLIDGISSFKVVKVEVEEAVHSEEGHPGAADTFLSIGSYIIVLLAAILTIILLCKHFHLRKRLVSRNLEPNIDVMSDVADALLYWPLLNESDQPLFREDDIELLRSISKEAEECDRSKDKPDFAEAVNVLVGGAATFVGTTLLPETFGSSISLIEGGGASSVNDVSTATGFALDKLRQETKRFEKAKPYFKLYIKIQKSLSISIVNISIAYDLIEFYRKNKKNLDKLKLHFFVKETKELLNRIHLRQKYRSVTTQANVDDLMIYSEKLVQTLLEGLAKSELIPFSSFEEHQIAFKMGYQRTFDMIPETAIKLMSLHGQNNTRIFSLYTFINVFYAQGLQPQARSNEDLRSTVDSTSHRVEVQLLNVNDDKVQVKKNLEKIAKGVAVAALVLTFQGIAEDVAFLGKTIYDFESGKLGELPEALDDTADMMEKMNKTISRIS